MHGIELCIKLNGYIAYMLYAGSFSHNTEVPIDIKHSKNHLSLDAYTLFFGSLDVQIKILIN